MGYQKNYGMFDLSVSIPFTRCITTYARPPCVPWADSPGGWSVVPRVRERTSANSNRGRRIKCDELRPKCAQCVKRGVACRYDRYPAVISVGVGGDQDRPQQLFLLPTAPDGLTGMQRDWLAAARCGKMLMAGWREWRAGRHS